MKIVKLFLLISFFCGVAGNLGAQHYTTNEDYIQSILDDPDMAGNAISCLKEKGQPGTLVFSPQGISINCKSPKGKLNIEYINAKPLFDDALVQEIFKEARDYFLAKNLEAFQMNTLLAKNKTFILFYYYEPGTKELKKILFE